MKRFLLIGLAAGLLLLAACKKPEATTKTAPAPENAAAQTDTDPAPGVPTEPADEADITSDCATFRAYSDRGVLEKAGSWRVVPLEKEADLAPYRHAFSNESLQKITALIGTGYLALLEVYKPDAESEAVTESIVREADRVVASFSVIPQEAGEGEEAVPLGDFAFLVLYIGEDVQNSLPVAFAVNINS